MREKRARTRDLRHERPEQGPAIELTRKMSRIHAPHVEGHFGADASDTLLCAAVYLGMFENRLMNASKLADYVGVPRSTMDLEELKRVGRVERRARLVEGRHLLNLGKRAIATEPRM